MEPTEEFLECETRAPESVRMGPAPPESDCHSVSDEAPWLAGRPEDVDGRDGGADSDWALDPAPLEEDPPFLDLGTSAGQVHSR